MHPIRTLPGLRASCAWRLIIGAPSRPCRLATVGGLTAGRTLRRAGWPRSAFPLHVPRLRSDEMVPARHQDAAVHDLVFDFPMVPRPDALRAISPCPTEPRHGERRP